MPDSLLAPASGNRSVLDLHAVSPKDRFDAWAAAIDGSFVPLQAVGPDSDSRESFMGGLVSQPLGASSVSTVTGTAVDVHRGAREIAASDPGYIKLGFQLRGYSVVMQDGRDAALAPGDFALYDTTRPYVVASEDAFRMFVVMFPLTSLHVERDVLSDFTARRFSGRTGVGAIASRFLAEMARQLDADELPSALPLSDAVLDLVAAAIADRTEGTGGLSEDAHRRALRTRIESYITARLADPDLSVSSIAARHHISVRYMQKLFEEQHTTVRGWIRHRRLEASRRDLASSSIPVAAVGIRWGFADAAAFARAFRQEFGMPPSHYRASVRGVSAG
ncbi:helix-turn-helix domain-containing protein [Microbacterium koreense]|uniref:Helix-turn-helix domain-containing protein n=1 Tax=Microbacterium koreense TaxID=323761 RepID=A0ABW2ZUR2_9MICO